MKGIILFIILVLTACSSFGQELTVDDLLEFPNYSPKKMENYISRKGFIPAGTSYQNDTIIDTWRQALKKVDTTQPVVSRRVSKYKNGKEVSFCLQTSSIDEYNAALEKLKQEGFVYGTVNSNTDSSLLFQKKNMTVQAYTVTEDEVFYYAMYFQSKQLPSARSVFYANDLLQFSSHEYLASFFGSSNVKKDLYYFSDKEITKCSVLFPNTSRQAVFIWEDGVNMVGLEQVIIGGAVRTENTAGFTQQIVENNWTLENGIRFNMRLDQLVDLAGEDLVFYGRPSEYYLTVAPQHNKMPELSSMVLVLDCINCEGASLLDNKMIKSSEAFDNGLRLHVSMIVLLPEAPATDKIARR